MHVHHPEQQRVSKTAVPDPEQRQQNGWFDIVQCAEQWGHCRHADLVVQCLLNGEHRVLSVRTEPLGSSVSNDERGRCRMSTVTR